MSWHKASLDTCLTWIGWDICLDTWTVQVPEAKLALILTQIDGLRRAVKDLQSTIGRLLWLTGAWHHLRPLLIPLYRALSQIPTNMVGVGPILFRQLVDLVDDNLYLTQSLRAQRHTLRSGQRG